MKARPETESSLFNQFTYREYLHRGLSYGRKKKFPTIWGLIYKDGHHFKKGKRPAFILNGSRRKTYEKRKTSHLQSSRNLFQTARGELRFSEKLGELEYHSFSEGGTPTWGRKL